MIVEETLIIPLIIALNQGFKKLGLPSKYCIVTSWILGVLGVFAFPLSGTVALTVFKGLIFGSTASGLYDATKEGLIGVRKLIK